MALGGDGGGRCDTLGAVRRWQKLRRRWESKARAFNVSDVAKRLYRHRYRDRDRYRWSVPVHGIVIRRAAKRREAKISVTC